ncbi:maleylpyruvate isomerase family mycothiol-dependent enzyme [Actinophytocola sp.]|uniref:maleylpyruvate isomerase family mycothiol-dependent enzyme n=1 Tax=Actinophytocola sp. TaxID=1872138 RepID=UPI002ED67912
MDRAAMWQALDSERTATAGLLESLTPAEWEHASLCAGWRVREVAAHLTLGPEMGIGGAIVEFARARGSFNRVVDNTSRRKATVPTEQLVADLRRHVGSRRLAPGQTLADALMDVQVHTQDIAVPLGRDHPMALDAALASADHLWGMWFPFRPRRRLRGFRLTATDVDWSVGDGAEISGPIAALLPLLAGRTATLSKLTGAGVTALS